MSSTSTQSLAAQQLPASRWRLKVIADADPGAIARILQPFHSLNIVPFSVRVDRVGNAYLEVGVEITAADLLPEAFQAIVAKLGQLPNVMAAVRCD